MRNVIILFCIVFFIPVLACKAQQQSAEQKPDPVSQAVLNQEYQFVATFMYPTGGRQRSITGTYTLKVSKTEVTADLPYFGKVYNAQIGSTDGGIKFQSKDFNYTTKPGKKKSNEINIKTKDVPDSYELYLTVFENGSANLRVNSFNRQSISYSGDIRVLPNKNQ